ncbi:unnamed protein product [Ambrosiozyma monospora]|uniref:Unnamed protein product n=1 Tax=Ambrosiozyma monospora TaxID=43982 RepID=A0ACB5SVB7_AMBMO|nr:unnamed protein product [Ambrosiozyma monospora]
MLQLITNSRRSIHLRRLSRIQVPLSTFIPIPPLIPTTTTTTTISRNHSSFLPNPELYQCYKLPSEFQKAKLELHYQILQLTKPQLEPKPVLKNNKNHNIHELYQTSRYPTTFKKLLFEISQTELNVIQNSTILLLLSRLTPSQFASIFQILIQKGFNFNKVDKRTGLKTLRYLRHGSHFSFRAFVMCGARSNDEKMLVFTELYTDSMRLATIQYLIYCKMGIEAFEFLHACLGSVQGEEKKKLEKLVDLKKSISDNSSIETTGDDIPKVHKVDMAQELTQSFNRLCITNNKLPQQCTKQQIQRTVLFALEQILSIRKGKSKEEVLSDYLSVLNTYLSKHDFLDTETRILNNHIFLKFMIQSIRAPTNVILGYFVALYPKSSRLLKDLNIALHKRHADFKPPEVRLELVVGDRLPPLRTLALLYRSILDNVSYSPKLLFRNYVRVVERVQRREEKLIKALSQPQGTPITLASLSQSESQPHTKTTTSHDQSAKDNKQPIPVPNREELQQALHTLQTYHPFSKQNHNGSLTILLTSHHLESGGFHHTSTASWFIDQHVRHFGPLRLSPTVLTKLIYSLSFQDVSKASYMVGYFSESYQIGGLAYVGVIVNLLRCQRFDDALLWFQFLCSVPELWKGKSKGSGKEKGKEVRGYLVSLCYKFGLERVPDLDGFREREREQRVVLEKVFDGCERFSAAGFVRLMHDASDVDDVDDVGKVSDVSDVGNSDLLVDELEELKDGKFLLDEEDDKVDGKL